MIPKCPRLIRADSKFSHSLGLRRRPVVRKGRRFRASDSRWIQRFYCKECRFTFSSASFSSCFGQKKRRLNSQVEALLCSKVDGRQIARILRINRKTVARKIIFLGREARLENERHQAMLARSNLNEIQFDDLETSIHTKCKPVSVALAVEARSRKILSFQVSQMPAKGLLAEFSRRKYGPRSDQRSAGWKKLFQELKPMVDEKASITSDQNPHYPDHVRRFFPKAHHTQVKGQRGRTGGQGELKKIGFDPLFSLNHTCALLRGHISRLVRRTWSTSKRMDRLIDHLHIYVAYHNRRVCSLGTG